MLSINGNDIKAVRGDDVILTFEDLGITGSGVVVFTAKSGTTTIQSTASNSKFHLTPADTAIAGIYSYDIQQTDELVTTLKMGKLNLVQDVNV